MTFSRTGIEDSLHADAYRREQHLLAVISKAADDLGRFTIGYTVDPVHEAGRIGRVHQDLLAALKEATP